MTILNALLVLLVTMLATTITSLYDLTNSYSLAGGQPSAIPCFFQGPIKKIHIPDNCLIPLP